MYAKTTEFEQHQQELARLAKLLSHPARIAILEYLSGLGSCYSGDIANELPLSRTTVSQHLQELKNGGLIQGNVQGTNVCYCVNEEAFKEFHTLIQAFFLKISHNIRCCY